MQLVSANQSFDIDIPILIDEQKIDKWHMPAQCGKRYALCILLLMQFILTISLFNLLFLAKEKMYLLIVIVSTFRIFEIILDLYEHLG